MPAVSFGILSLWDTEANGQEESCHGGTACPVTCPECCQPDCQNCLTLCEGCDNSELPPTCCSWGDPDDDGCEDYPPTSECCGYQAPDACEQTPVVIIDLSGDDPNYAGRPLGLYIDSASNPSVQTNLLSEAGGHFDAAMKAGARIVPRDDEGDIDWDEGLVGVMSLGFSNPTQEFEAFINNHVVVAQDPPTMNSRLVFVNGGEGGNSLCHWRTAYSGSEFDPWEMILGEDEIEFSKLEQGKAPGQSGTCDEQNPEYCTIVAKEQIQVVWMKLIYAKPLLHCSSDDNDCQSELCADPLCGEENCQFPNWVLNSTDSEVAAYAEVLAHLREYFPNLAMVFISNRAYGGYANGCTDPPADPDLNCNQGSLEPYAYFNSFTVQELMRRQIFDTTPTRLPFGPTDDYPLILWGPQLWAKGTTQNPTAYRLGYEDEDLRWDCWEWCADGQHTSADDITCNHVSGRSKIAGLLLDFFTEDLVATEWFRPRPAINHGLSGPPNGRIDRLQDFKRIGETLYQQGTSQVQVVFTHEVRKPGGGSVDSTCFSVESTCQELSTPCTTGDVLPSIQSVVQDQVDPKKYVVTLSRQIVPGHWTTLIANVEMATAPYEVVRSDPFNRIDLGFLPGDCTADNEVTDHDLARLLDVLNEEYPEDLSLHDINRNGSITNADKVRLEQLLEGTDTSQAWEDYELPQRP